MTNNNIVTDLLYTILSLLDLNALNKEYLLFMFIIYAVEFAQ